MDNKTKICFVGDLIQEFPEMIRASQEMATGNVFSWINAGIEVIGSAGKIVKLIMDKRNTKLLKKELDNFDAQEKERQNQLEQEMLMKEFSFIESVKADFEKNRKKLSEKIKAEQSASCNKIQDKMEISAMMTGCRSKLKKLIDIYDKELSEIVKREEFSEKEKREYEECKRCLLQQFPKNIDI